MSRQIHFEVFLRRGASPSWLLHDATPDREEAIATAKQQLKNGFATGAKVVRETYDESVGAYTALTVFEELTRAFKEKPMEEQVKTALPCLTPDDFYSAHARHILSRLFVDTLARWKLTITELLHRADMLEKLEATGTLFQHAVQKYAVAQAGSTGTPVIQIIRAANDLADRALQRVYREARSKRLMPCETAAELAVFAESRAADPDASFIIGVALATYLKPAQSWVDKLDKVLQVITSESGREPGRLILIRLADATVSEILAGATALQELIGPMPDLGSALIAMSDLYLGRPPADGAKTTLARLSAHFGKDALLDARTALAKRVLAELKAYKKLAPTVDGEMRYLRAITSRLVLGPPALMAHHDIVSAVTMRSRRLVDADAIGTVLGEGANPVVKIERLLVLEENIVGAENKRRLWEFVRPILTSAALEAALCDRRLVHPGEATPFDRLRDKLAKSGFGEAAKSEALTWLDGIVKRTGAIGVHA